MASKKLHQLSFVDGTHVRVLARDAIPGHEPLILLVVGDESCALSPSDARALVRALEAAEREATKWCADGE